MRLPAYLLLPIIGAVALVAAVLGSWLWPEPAVPSPSLAPAVIAAPVAVQPSPPPPAAMPPQPRPMPRPTSTRPVEPPQQPVAEPVVVAPPPSAPPPVEPPPGPTTSPRMADWSPEVQNQVKQNWASIKDRSAELAMAGLKHSERQRDEARARGDQAEVDRLEEIIRTQREQVDKIQRAQQAAGSRPAGAAPEMQAGPPVQ